MLSEIGATLGRHALRFGSHRQPDSTMSTRHAAQCLSPHAAHSQAPWVLSTIELVSVLLIYFLGTSKSLIIHESTSNYHFYWRCSLEDILGLAIARSLILSVTYAWGVHSVQRCVAP